MWTSLGSATLPTTKAVPLEPLLCVYRSAEHWWRNDWEEAAAVAGEAHGQGEGSTERPRVSEILPVLSWNGRQAVSYDITAREREPAEVIGKAVLWRVISKTCGREWLRSIGTPGHDAKQMEKLDVFSQLTEPCKAEVKHHCPQLPWRWTRAGWAPCPAWPRCAVCGQLGTPSHPWGRDPPPEGHRSESWPWLCPRAAHVPVSSGQGNSWALFHTSLLNGVSTEMPAGHSSDFLVHFLPPCQPHLHPAPAPCQSRRAPSASSPSICTTLAQEGSVVWSVEPWKHETTLPSLPEGQKTQEGWLGKACPRRGGLGALTHPHLPLDGSLA